MQRRNFKENASGHETSDTPYQKRNGLSAQHVAQAHFSKSAEEPMPRTTRLPGTPATGTPTYPVHLKI